MELQITGQNMEVSSEVRRYVERKIGKLTRHFPNIIESIVEINQEKTRSPQQHFMVRASVNGNGISTCHRRTSPATRHPSCRWS